MLPWLTLITSYAAPDESAGGGEVALNGQLIPRISQLQHELRRWDAHPQNYGSGSVRRRLDTTLTSLNTAPMRIHLDTRSL